MKSWSGPLVGLMVMGCMPSGGSVSESQLVDEAGRERALSLWAPRVDGPLDVVVVLDGDRRFASSARRTARLVRDGWIPPAAVVGVPAIDPLDYAPGEALEAEYAFLTETLLPWIEDEVGADGRRILMGHDLGGLATVWSALQEPVVMDGFVAASPALYWSDGVIFEIEEARGQSGGDLPAQVYLSAGGRERWGAGGRLLTLTERLSNRPYPSMELAYEIIEGRSETTIYGTAFDLGVTFALGQPEAAP